LYCVIYLFTYSCGYCKGFPGMRLDQFGPHPSSCLVCIDSFFPWRYDRDAAFKLVLWLVCIPPVK